MRAHTENTKSKSVSKRKLVVLSIVTTAVLGTAIVIPQREHLPPKFCSVCLLRQDSLAWRLPFNGPTVFAHHQESPTPVSTLFTEKQISLPHQHSWQAERVTTNPLDPSAPPVVQSLDFVNVPRVVSFLRDVLTYADAESVQRWKEITLTFENATLMDDALRFCRFPSEGFADKRAFMAWWSRGGARALAHRIEQQTHPD